MTVTLFVAFLTFGAMASALLTEAIKKFCENAQKEYSSNAIALGVALGVGLIGTSIAYVLLGIPWTVSNVICMVLMALCMWVGSMVSYDKVIQLVKQLEGLVDKE